MRTLFSLIAALALCAAGCSSSSGQCTEDAGGGLPRCSPLPDGGSADCAPGEACAPFVSPGNERCMKLCNTTGGCTQAGTVCSAVAVGVCDHGDGGEDSGTPQCYTDFLCYPNRCATAVVQ